MNEYKISIRLRSKRNHIIFGQQTSLLVYIKNKEIIKNIRLIILSINKQILIMAKKSEYNTDGIRHIQHSSRLKYICRTK